MYISVMLVNAIYLVIVSVIVICFIILLMDKQHMFLLM